jgi:hypothetical protein
MALSIFEDKSKVPGDADLSKALGGNYRIWIEIKEYVIDSFPGAIEEWNHSGRNYGWGFRLKDKKRVIIYMIPCDGFFRIALVYGEKATHDALLSSISGDVKKIIETAPVYGEGRGFRIDIKSSEQIPDVKELVRIKLNN